MAIYVAGEIARLMSRKRIHVNGARVLVLGMTFKENCPDIRNSKVIDIVRELQSYGIEVVVSDPHADVRELEHEYGLRLGRIDADHPVDTLIVAVSHREYKALPAASLRAMVRGGKPVLVDVKSIFHRAELEAAGFIVWRL
jgi:UDP-N-acetyl-D-galactosamine dehydrogenase